MAKVKDICNFFNSGKEVDIPAFATGTTDDVSQSKLLIVENEIKKPTQIKKTASTISQKKSEVGTYAVSWNQNCTRTFQ